MRHHADERPHWCKTIPVLISLKKCIKIIITFKKSHHTQMDPWAMTIRPSLQITYCLKCTEHGLTGSNTQPLHKGVNLHSKVVTQVQQQRPEPPTVTLTWHACKYKVHKLHQRYILIGSYTIQVGTVIHVNCFGRTVLYVCIDYHI